MMPGKLSDPGTKSKKIMKSGHDAGEDEESGRVPKKLESGRVPEKGLSEYREC